MRTMMTALAVAMICTTSAFAQAAHPIQPAAAPTAEAEAEATIAQASWLAGRWVGQGLGGEMEETWSPPVGGQMVGHFRLVEAGAPTFYEFMMLDAVEGGVRMRVKHFNPDFVGWEERDAWHTFGPVSASADELNFDGLAIRRAGPDAIEMRLTLSSNGVERVHVLTFQRASLD